MRELLGDCLEPARELDHGTLEFTWDLELHRVACGFGDCIKLRFDTPEGTTDFEQLDAFLFRTPVQARLFFEHDF